MSALLTVTFMALNPFEKRLEKYFGTNNLAVVDQIPKSNNKVDEMQDLLNIKEQMMNYQTMHNMNQIALEEKDAKIVQLTQEIERLEKGGKFNFVDEQREGDLVQKNTELEGTARLLQANLDEAYRKLEELTKVLESGASAADMGVQNQTM